MGSFCGTNSQTVTQTATNPAVTAQQNQIYSMLNQYSNMFGGNPSALIAPQNQLQTSAEQGVANNAYANQPWNYIGQGMIGQGASTTGMAPSLYGQGASTLGGVNPLSNTAWNPTAYESPYTQDVIGATMANIQRQNAIAQNGALGNAIASGNAFGGDRAGVAAAELARNQELAANQTMAGLSQANFNQASQQANAQQQYLLNLGLGNNAQLMQQAGLYGNLGAGLTQAGLGMGSLGYQAGYLGNAGQGATLNALQGLYNMGTGLQNTQQQMLSAPLTLGSWYSSASPGVNTVPTSTVYPGASPAGSIAGLGLSGLAGANLFSNLGGFGALGSLFGGGGDAAGAIGGALGAVGALANRGGRVGDHHHDLLSRYHHIRSALRRDAGGAAGMPQMAPNPLALASNVPHAQDMATTQAAQRQRMYHLMGSVGNAAAPAQQQAAEQMLATQQVHRGGAIHKDGGGEAMPDVGASSVPSSPTLGGSISVAELGPQDKMNAFKQLMKLAHRGADLLTTPNTSASDPTKAPNAPGQGSQGLTPAQALTLAKLGSNSQSNGTTFPSSSSDDSMWVARGGRTIGDLGRQHFDDGGGADLARQDYQQDMAQDAEDAGPQSPSGGGGGGFDPYRYMPKPTPYQSAMQSPWMALLRAGGEMMQTHRNPNGTVESGLGNIGRGLSAGAEYATQQQRYDLEQHRVALEAMARQQAAAQLAQQADIARGTINGVPTLAARPHFQAIQNEWGAQTPGTFDPLTGKWNAATTGEPGSAGNTAAGTGTAASYSLPTSLDWSKTGQEFLTQLPPQWANTVKAIIDGREQYPSINSRDPRAKATLAMVNQVDPSFDATQWRTKNQAQAAFGSGTEARNIQALDMLLHHAEQLSQSAEDLGNWNYPGGNLVRHGTNLVAGQFPNTGARFKRFQDDADAVAEELSKVFHGGPSVTGVEHWRDAIGNTTSSAELRAHTGEAINLAEGRLKGLQDQYERVFNHPPPRPFISPEQQARIDRLKNIGRLGISPQEYDQRYGKVGAPGSATDQGSLTRQQQALPRLTPENADAEFARLAPGQKFIDPTGHVRIKPQAP